MALSTGIGAETQRPLAVVVIGGLVTATLLVLFVMPVLYVMLHRVSRLRRERRRGDGTYQGPDRRRRAGREPDGGSGTR